MPQFNQYPAPVLPLTGNEQLLLAQTQSGSPVSVTATVSDLTPGLIAGFKNVLTANGQLLIGSAGNAPVAATLTGTANQIIVTNGAGSVSISLPQSIDTNASVTFGSIVCTGALTVGGNLTVNGTGSFTTLSASGNIKAAGSIYGINAQVTRAGSEVIGSGPGYWMDNGATGSSERAMAFQLGASNELLIAGYNGSAWANLAVVDAFGNLTLNGIRLGNGASSTPTSGFIQVSNGTPNTPYASPVCAYFFSSNADNGNAVEIYQGNSTKAALVLSANNTGTQTAVALYEAGAQVGSITTTTTATAYNTSSDSRMKRKIGIATSVDALRDSIVYDFAWRSTGELDRGVFAQEAHNVNRRAVTVGDDGEEVTKPWQVDYSKYVPDLIVGWQQHDARFDRIEAALAKHGIAVQ